MLVWKTEVVGYYSELLIIYESKNKESGYKVWFLKVEQPLRLYWNSPFKVLMIMMTIWRTFKSQHTISLSKALLI